MSLCRRFPSRAVLSPTLVAASLESRNNPKSMARMPRAGAAGFGCSSLPAPELGFVCVGFWSARGKVGRLIVKDNQALLGESEVQVIFSPHVINICC